MKVFVTGATGFVGSAVVQELLKGGHQVIGMARSDAGAKKLNDLGITVHRGDVEDLESLKKGAAMADGVIHTAMNHDFSKFAKNCEDDRKAIETLGTVLIGSDRPLVITSGTALAKPGQLATETDRSTMTVKDFPRAASEQEMDRLAAKGVRVSAVRLSPSVHGDGDNGFMAGFVTVLMGMAKEKGVSAYIGEGKNRWSAVHRLDAAKIYQLALEKNKVPGTRYHGVGDEGVEFKKIAEAVGKVLNVPTVSLSTEAAAKHFGWFAHFAALDCPASSKLTQEQLGWKPNQLGLIEDLAKMTSFGGYV